MNEPMVTCVIPCHNHSQWVWGAIESVAEQTYANKRVVVIDDGSTDGSSELVGGKLYRPKALKAKVGGNPEGAVGTFPNTEMQVYMLRYPNASGPSFARNRGMEVLAESTDIFAFLDSDDEYHPKKMEKSVEKILSHPDMVGVVYSDFETLNPNGLYIRQFKEPFSREWLLQECIVNCNSLVTKRAIVECGGFDEEMRVAEDYDLWLRISERYLIFHIPESLVTIRVGSHSSSSTVTKEVWQQNWQRVMLKVRARAGGTG